MSDPIERQEVMDAIYKCTDIYINNLPIMIDKAELYKAISELPSAQPEPHYCRECKWSRCHINVDKYGNTETYWHCFNWDGGTDEEGYCYEWGRRTDGSD